jgi:2,4-dienoyl-CoA reductase-like NADH-dependent reductase (Old Yellow Enzyme family)
MSAPTLMPVHGDLVIPRFHELVDRIHPHGLKVFQHLWHGGSAFPLNLLGAPPWTVSDGPDPEAGTVPLPMTKTMIDDEVAGYGGQVVLVGDATGSRTLQTAISEGHMATRMV